MIKVKPNSTGIKFAGCGGQTFGSRTSLSNPQPKTQHITVLNR